MRIGYFLSSEEHAPATLVRQARLAEEYGFSGLWISDHVHPWNDQQGHSPFVWSVLGAIAQATSRIAVTTAVTCPTVRLHPAVVAHAAATSAVLFDGRFALGVGSGEALNEHILGDGWPPANERLEMLEEAVLVIRLLWEGGVKSHRGRHYRVDHTRLYDLPERPPKILVSGFGPQAISLAARIGDGFVSTKPDAEAVGQFRREAPHGESARVAAGTKVCWGQDEARARRTAHRLWPNEALGGELSQVLPTPAHFEQAAQLVTEEMVARAIPCGPQVERQIEWFERYEQAGFDELYVQQVGGADERFFDTYANEVLPRFHAAEPTHANAGGEGIATDRQHGAARRNITRAQGAGARGTTLARLPRRTRTAPGREAATVRQGGEPTRRELEEQARRLDIRGRSKMGKAELSRAVTERAR